MLYHFCWISQGAERLKSSLHPFVDHLVQWATEATTAFDQLHHWAGVCAKVLPARDGRLCQSHMTALVDGLKALQSLLAGAQPGDVVEVCGGGTEERYWELGAELAFQLVPFEQTAVRNRGELMAVLRPWQSDRERHLHALSMVRSARIVFSTVCCAGRSVVTTVELDEKTADPFAAVVIDEAAQLTEGEMSIALWPHVERLVLVGDPKQLPAHVYSSVSLTNGYQRSAMERLMAAQLPAALLSTQYRMHPHIAAWPNVAFYGGALVSDESVQERCLRPVLGDSRLAQCRLFQPFVFLQVDGLEERDRDSRSLRNSQQLQMGRAVFLALQRAVSRRLSENAQSSVGNESKSKSAHEEQGHSSLSSLSVGLISPYLLHMTDMLASFNLKDQGKDDVRFFHPSPPASGAAVQVQGEGSGSGARAVSV